MDCSAGPWTLHTLDDWELHAQGNANYILRHKAPQAGWWGLCGCI